MNATLKLQEEEAHKRQVEAARAHAQQLAADRAKADREAEETRAALAAESARLIAAREAFEREQAAERKSPERKSPEPEPIADDAPTVDALPPVYRVEADGDMWTISYLDSEGDTVFIGSYWENEDEADEGRTIDGSRLCRGPHQHDPHGSDDVKP